MSEFDGFDELLDGVLREDGRVEPPVGMERRVLARVREASPARRVGWRVWWGLAGAVAAGLVVLGIWMPGGARKVEVRRASVGVEVKTEVSPHEEMSEVASSESARVVRARVGRAGLRKVNVSSEAKEELPKLDVFPSPVPLSAEERALVEFGRQHPEEAKKLMAVEKADKADVAIKPLKTEPVQIAALVIEPIDTELKGDKR